MLQEKIQIAAVLPLVDNFPESSFWKYAAISNIRLFVVKEKKISILVFQKILLYFILLMFYFASYCIILFAS